MPIHITQVNHVAMLVSDLERSLAFYRDGLCLAPKPRPKFGDKGAWFQIAPGQELHIVESEHACNLPNEAPTHFALVIEDQSEALAHLDEMQIPYSEPKARPDGGIQIFVRDPDNQLIELTCNLPE